MPTYEYLCKTCNLRFDAFQSFSEDAFTICDQAPITCPQNGGGELRKVFGNVGITFKGSGFYKNDSRGATSSTTTTTTESSPKSDSPSSSDSPGSASSPSSESSPGSTSSPGSSGSSDGGPSHSHSHGPSTHTH